MSMSKVHPAIQILIDPPSSLPSTATPRPPQRHFIVLKGMLQKYVFSRTLLHLSACKDFPTGAVYVAVFNGFQCTVTKLCIGGRWVIIYIQCTVSYWTLLCTIYKAQCYALDRSEFQCIASIGGRWVIICPQLSVSQPAALIHDPLMIITRRVMMTDIWMLLLEKRGLRLSC